MMYILTNNKLIKKFIVFNISNNCQEFFSFSRVMCGCMWECASVMNKMDLQGQRSRFNLAKYFGHTKKLLLLLINRLLQ